MDYIKGLDDNAFELAIVDPPYGIETKGNAQDRFSNGMQLDSVNDNKPTQEYFKELFRVSENQIIWGYNWLSNMLPKCREFIFWYKRQPVITFADGELAWSSFQRTAKCLDLPYHEANELNKGCKIHPTQKPVKLYQWLLKNYAKEGDRILDTHLGSGSSAIAAHYTGYEFVGMELDKDYYDAACKRFDSETAQQAMF